MNYEVIIPKPVQKQLKSFPDDVQTRLNEKILLLTDEPRPSGVKKLKGYANEYRLRVGDYRVRYEIDDQGSVVIILSCRHRKDAYKG
ncbi:type II toxin-antitoxin system RelE family toxin [Microcystis aeruginosa]|jgi:mRNA interferase RelE/StbE|uniref:Type II toxin-antitoxin system mRNA interferase toxin, RelE/StbE family n=3 Tax=Microcystis TaxID=1125 RepID=A0A857D755_MICAE|nr:type II toxin-antitoxin system RelE/ParE family toxin [Microcystis aeruginosa]NCR10220.1 type II toxin-antitoxin system RelE/ParE family toxin [Microcystis aeruginosa LG13-11]TRU97452.1 MAG: type II toxin-antitoxin system RelE/ParE family toxin [Microcystis wesenbergii Mw_QC_S_20081001_S30]TRU97624.1 MAG: type II toxin-antitoxin system RelE/ParE family toxin [Microcystis wesenbergii Mw_QC_S_20081001_S30D]TRU97796.1 MAG: type II toxin-antitoxin system RelE/ParE family toxin [Microcystis wesen